MELETENSSFIEYKFILPNPAQEKKILPKISFIIFINFLFLILFQNIYSQVTIEGKIKNIDNNIVDGVYVILFENNITLNKCITHVLQYYDCTGLPTKDDETVNTT